LAKRKADCIEIQEVWLIGIKLSETLFHLIKESISAWEDDDIYAISLFVYDIDDDCYQLSVTVGYNTVSYYEDSIEDADGDEGEAKWNYAYWIQNELVYFGYDSHKALFDEWMEKNGYRNLPEDEGPDYDEKGFYIGKGPAVTRKFIEELIETAHMLHKSKLIEAKTGRPVPIIIHELEYYDAIANQTMAANPAGLADEFCNWVRKVRF